MLGLWSFQLNWPGFRPIGVCSHPSLCSFCSEKPNKSESTNSLGRWGCENNAYFVEEGVRAPAKPTLILVEEFTHPAKPTIIFVKEFAPQAMQTIILYHLLRRICAQAMQTTIFVKEFAPQVMQTSIFVEDFAPRPSHPRHFLDEFAHEAIRSRGKHRLHTQITLRKSTKNLGGLRNQVFL